MRQLKKKALVGLSGGVDSAITVKKLLEEGYTVAGLYLDMHSFDSEKPVRVLSTDGENSDIASALQCADSYGIELYKFGCATKFDEIVKDDFAREYSLGRTPNPCVICNKLVKFASLLECADALGYGMIATGHYATVGQGENGRYYIERGRDSRKDQSYMLWKLSQHQLSRLILPLGDSLKDDNFEAARSDGLSAAERGESLDICFIGKDDNYADFIERRLGAFPEGDFIAPDGSVCGRHKGIIRYTVGQRKGLGIALGQPAFVKRIDGRENRIYLAFSGDEYTDRVEVSGLNFVGMEETASFEGELLVKIRYAAKPVLCRVTIQGDKCTAIFPEPVRAATPGQSAVFYDCDRVMFGGFID